jgi:hypothetical protein
MILFADLIPFGLLFLSIVILVIHLDYSRVEVAGDSVAKSVANVAISCFWRIIMRSPRSLRSLVMTWSSTALAL